VVIDEATIDALLGEIRDPALRREVLRAMWNIADADGVLADAEATLLSRACTVWSAESSFVSEEARRATVG
jgi:uncharacterized tellurite resistance protein B-like protein